MLILTRRISESLIIHDDIQVTVLSVKGNQVRLGVEAPKSVSVHRKELYQRIQADKGNAREIINTDRSVTVSAAKEAAS